MSILIGIAQFIFDYNSRGSMLIRLLFEVVIFISMRYLQYGATSGN